MPGLQATDLLATLLACSGRRHNQLFRLSHECKLGDQTKDDADKEPREERSCGRSQTSLYNPKRRHSTIGYTSPHGVREAGWIGWSRCQPTVQLNHCSLCHRVDVQLQDRTVCGCCEA